MKHVSDLPEALQDALDGQGLIVFDGVCVLCSGFFQFVLRHDRAQRFQFATAQSPLGQALYGAMGLPIDDFETNLVIIDGRIHQRLGAFAAAMGALPWPWKALSAARFIPEPFSSWMYHAIARNRFRLFGRREQCLLPDAETRNRFLDMSDAA
ncbi:MAG: DCC1-like thiol-disulfide oxidoreductase family protein [Pseudomonadota bacterium]